MEEELKRQDEERTKKHNREVEIRDKRDSGIELNMEEKRELYALTDVANHIKIAQDDEQKIREIRENYVE